MNRDDCLARGRRIAEDRYDADEAMVEQLLDDEEFTVAAYLFYEANLYSGFARKNYGADDKSADALLAASACLRRAADGHYERVTGEQAPDELIPRASSEGEGGGA